MTVASGPRDSHEENMTLIVSPLACAQGKGLATGRPWMGHPPDNIAFGGAAWGHAPRSDVLMTISRRNGGFG
jgi:hypothetical protein